LNLTWLDWGIVAFVLVFMISGVYISKNLMRSVADFLAAGRTAGRYLVSVGQWIAGLGAITIIANFEMNYVAGFAMSWWGLSMAIVVLILTVSGWVVYRFRQTRALTMAQFFEIRYSRNFRIFAGVIAFLSGIIKFRIFPSVGVRFFI
jgi:SSS family solute:Na+ symporter